MSSRVEVGAPTSPSRSEFSWPPETVTSEANDSDVEISNAKVTLDAVKGDGACNTREVYKIILDCEVTPVIPPQKNAKINRSGPPLPRDETSGTFDSSDLKCVYGYHRRSLVEIAVYRFKMLMERFVEARTWEMGGPKSV